MSSVGATRFYKPTPAKLTGRELMFAGGSLDRDYRRGTELDVPDFDFAAPMSSHRIMTKRVALQGSNRPGDFEMEFFDMGPFQITYNFSRGIRKNTFPLKNVLPYQPKVTGEYGAGGWSFRMLYEFLCEAYNGGYPFVDTYFGQIFKTRSVYAEFKGIYDTIQESINAEQLSLFMSLPLKKDGTPDMRYTASKRYKDFKVWQDPIVKQDCKILAKAIRDDIVVCLSTGRIPLRKQEVSWRGTRQARAKLVGLNPSRFFFASGQLIRHLNIYVKVGRATA
jgi:hypothetical protein